MECELGVFVNCPHPEIIESIGIAGFDFAVVDMEHSPLGPSDLYPLVLAAERRDLSLVVRIPEKSDSFYKWCGDLGVNRIQVPHIKDSRDVESAVMSYFFSPKGERGLSRFVRAADYSAMPKDKYLSGANDSNQLILQIEGSQAVENLPEILRALPKGTSIFIGPYDLSQSLGCPGEIWDEKVIEVMEDVITQCQVAKIKVGTFTDSYDGLKFWAQRGLNFIEFASELNLFIESAQDLTSRFRALRGSIN